MSKMYTTPGVYIEEINKFPPSITGVETAVPAFIGYTEKATLTDIDDLHLKPVRIDSMIEYMQHFGGAQKEENIEVSIDEQKDETDKTISQKQSTCFIDSGRSKHIMYYALQLFFNNGGGPCYIVSVSPYESLGTDLNIEKLKDGLKKLENREEPTLIIFPEAQYLTTINDFQVLYNSALEQCEALKNRFVVMDVYGCDEQSLLKKGVTLLDTIRNFRDNGIGNDNLKYGAAYAPNINTTLDFVVDETKIKVKYTVTPAPVNPAQPGVVTLDSLKITDNNTYEKAKKALRDMHCPMPPSAAIAGIYASVDKSRGVWTAPANVTLKAITEPVTDCSKKEQDFMNIDAKAGKSVNAIRSFIGKGTMVWGARTLAGNDNEWRYINVRRFINFVEESTKKGAMQFVFEPNTVNTWVKVHASIENFLTTLWRQGALQGDKSEHAFYVAVGLGKTMTPLDIVEGNLILEIGMAVVRPAEFIILQFSQKMAAS